MRKVHTRFFIDHVVRLCIICLATAVSSFAQANDATDASWAATSQNQTANANPYRTAESHVKSGNRTLDKKTVEVRGPDGTYQLYYRTEIETVQESPTLTRSITRTYNLGGDRNEHLTQIIEVESRASDEGSRSVKTISNVNLDGKFEVKAREISVAEKTADVEKTQTTLYFPSTASEFAASMQTKQEQTRSPEGTIHTKKETSFPDFQGGWQTYEIREQTVKGDSEERTTDERLSRRDFLGNVTPVSESITKYTSANGRATTATQTYSVDIPGSARDQSLHPLKLSTAVQTTEAGRIVTNTQVLEPDTVEKGSNTVVNTMDIVVQESSGSKQTITVIAQYPDGYPSVVSVDTRETRPQH
jgi:hypothetical protein